MTELTATRQAEASADRRVSVIDCDIHNAMPNNETLYKYLSPRWRRYHEMMGLRGHVGSSYPRAMPNASRHDAWPPSGLPPGGDLDFMRTQLLDAWDLELGILNCLFGAGGATNPSFAAALSSAVNDWQIAEWLEPEPRLRASLIVPYEDGAAAAAEIDRVGDHPGYVQVLLVVRTREPLGHRKYWKMYEAAVRHNLPIGIHFGGAGGGPITGTGWPSHYIEDHAGMPQAFQPQVISLVTEGVFEHFPTLKIVLIEGGFAWMPPLMWRLDQAWRRLKEETPYLTRLPSEIIREHFWLTTQPIEEPPQPRFFTQLLAQMDMNDRLMFATDYPHWDFDAPDRALPSSVSADVRSEILAGNARRLYGLVTGA
ncbi:amidohydrolase family protein [bacterium]|nr:amidohydrolase family protein [bacterium]